MAVIIYRFPWFVSGSGPIKLILTLFQGAEMGIGYNSFCFPVLAWTWHWWHDWTYYLISSSIWGQKYCIFSFCKVLVVPRYPAKGSLWYRYIIAAVSSYFTTLVSLGHLALLKRSPSTIWYLVYHLLHFFSFLLLLIVSGILSYSRKSLVSLYNFRSILYPISSSCFILDISLYKV